MKRARSLQLIALGYRSAWPCRVASAPPTVAHCTSSQSVAAFATPAQNRQCWQRHALIATDCIRLPQCMAVLGRLSTTNTQSPNPYRLGFFLPAPPVKTPLASRASRPGRRVFRPDSLKFFSLLSIHPKSGESFARTSSMMDAGKVPKLRNPQESFHFCSHVQHHLSGHDSLLLGPPDLPVQ